MVKKKAHSTAVSRRVPSQERATEKVELIFEAALQLIEERGLEALTTNAIAAKAGVSIGTLYQYFRDKDAILDALSGRELKGLGSKVMESMDPAVPGTSEE